MKYNIKMDMIDGEISNNVSIEKISSIILYSRLKMLNLLLVYVILIFGRSYGYSEEYQIKIISRKNKGADKKENVSDSSSNEKLR